MDPGSRLRSAGMVRRVASHVSMRSRQRKLDLFRELLRPGPGTTVVDVGVTDAPFGAGSTDNFFEALYPWPERITAVGNTGLDRFRARCYEGIGTILGAMHRYGAERRAACNNATPMRYRADCYRGAAIT